MYLSSVKTENKYSVLILLSWIIGILPSCQKQLGNESPANAVLEIRFHPQLDGFPLEYGTTYQLPTGEAFEPRVFKFYAGKISLQQRNGSLTSTTKDPYYLLGAASEDELTIRTTIPPGTYSNLEFLLGVDSARNVSGVQSGALDPLKGMFWTWNSGYIFAKLEGISPSSSVQGNKVEYHVGGFRVPFNAAQAIRLPLAVSGELELKAGQTCILDIAVTLDNWFTGPYPFSISDHPVCMTPGELAWNISRNFSGLFSVTNLSIEE
ncbi:MAG: hypothetical protein A1D16_21515 [Flavihumibacter sp. CACIAM 22H1]|nr:MAG: hypothetical protein A1D16_21515 [Flavihumibacter sp. CACIAM 22H1]